MSHAVWSKVYGECCTGKSNCTSTRWFPRPGDRQEVITKDNVVVAVNATIFTQVVDAKQALFSIANFDVAIDALARTALRSVIGTMTLDEALSERAVVGRHVR